jgi:hypothetical protein
MTHRCYSCACPSLSLRVNVISDSEFESHRMLNLSIPSVYTAITNFGLIIIPYPCHVNEQELGLHCVKTSVEYCDKRDKPYLF